MKRELMGHMHNVIGQRRKIARERLEPLGISPGQPAVLKYLAKNDGSIQRDIAINCNIKAASVVPVLDGLERSGWVRRISDDNDRRAWRIFLTEQGRETCIVLDEIFTALDDVCLVGLSDNDISTMTAALEQIENNLNKLSSSE